MLLFVFEREVEDTDSNENELCRHGRLNPLVSMYPDSERVEVRFGSALLVFSFFLRPDLRVRFLRVWGPTSSTSSDSLM